VNKAVELKGRTPAHHFHELGYCHLKNGLTSTQVDDCHTQITNLFNSTMLSIRHRDQEQILHERGFDKFKLRQPGRYDMSLDLNSFPYLTDEKAPWLAVVKKILGPQAALVHAG
jgi:hypothetical protein